jgi:hypothetical protein
MGAGSSRSAGFSAFAPPGMPSVLSFRRSTGGEPVRALLLRRHGLDWARSISAVTMDCSRPRRAQLWDRSIRGVLLANGGYSAATPWVSAGWLGLMLLALLYVHLFRAPP